MTKKRETYTGPPQWPEEKIKKQLKTIRKHCIGLSVVELDAVDASTVKMLTAAELERYKKMGLKRGKSFLCARAVCKLLSRKLSGNLSAPADKINTITEGKPYPACPLPDGSAPYICSVAHDSAFAIAVASDRKIGVDVEPLSDRAFRASGKFMSGEEISVAGGSDQGEELASLIIWSVKEAVTKALRTEMHKTWKFASVAAIGKKSSKVKIEDKYWTAYHDIAEGHLFTIIELD